MRHNAVTRRYGSSKPFVYFLGSLAVKIREINHEGNHHLPPASTSFLGWAVPTERLIWLYARRWGFWDRPGRACSCGFWPRASGPCVSLPLSVSPASCPVFWSGWVGAGFLCLPCFIHRHGFPEGLAFSFVISAVPNVRDSAIYGEVKEAE